MSITNFPNVERVYLDYINGAQRRGEPWYISEALNSDILPGGMGDASSFLNAVRGAQTQASRPFTISQPAAVRTGVSPWVTDISALIGVVGQTYATYQAANAIKKSPQEAGAILRQTQGVQVPPGQENAIAYAAQMDAKAQINPQQLLLWGAVGLGALLLLRRR